MNEDGDYMDGYNDGFIDGRGTMLKPLRWRTGPVPVDANGIGMEVYFELRDGRGHGLGTGEKKGGVWEGDWHLRKESILRWLPLSEILALVEE